MNGCVGIVSVLLWLIVTAISFEGLALRKPSRNALCTDKQAMFVRNIHADAGVTAKQKCNAVSRSETPHAEMTCVACRLAISAEQVCTMHKMHMHCSLLKIKLGLSC